MRWILAACVLVGLVESAAADDETLVGYGQFSLGGGLQHGALSDSGGAQPVRLGGGLRIGDLAIESELSWGLMGSSDPELHSEELSVLSFGPQLKVFLFRRRYFELYARAGVARQWISGQTEVQRTCSLTDECAAGFYREKPAYDAIAFRGGLGSQVTVDSRGFYGGFWIDIGVDRSSIDFFGESLQQTAITLAVGASLGAGRTR